MNKYLFLYWAPGGPSDAQPSPEEMQQMLAQWTEWKRKFNEQVIDLGDGLKPGGKVLRNAEVTDGPFAEMKEIVAGYSVIVARNYDEALEVARACPMSFVPGAVIELREMAGFEG